MFSQDNARILPYNTVSDKSEADIAGLLETSRDSKEIMTLAIYNIRKASKEQKTDSAIKAFEMMDRAFKVSRRRDSTVAAIYGMISLINANLSGALNDKITYTNRGVNGFDLAMELAPNNFEIKALYMVSVVEVPTFFLNLTDNMIKKGEEFLMMENMQLNQQEKEIWVMYSAAVKYILAECYTRKGESVKARNIVKGVNIDIVSKDSLLSGTVKKYYDKYKN